LSKLKVSAQEGGALVLALIVLAIGALLVPVFLSHASTNLLATRVTEEDMKELYAADAGVEYALGHLLHGVEPEGGWGGLPKFEINNKTVTVTIDIVPQDLFEDGLVYEIISTATSDDEGSTTLKSLVWVSDVGDVSFIAGDFTWTGGKPFSGSVYAAGDIDLGKQAQIKGNAYADGDITLGEQAQIHGDACAAGDIDLGTQAQIHGNVSAGGYIELGTQAQIHGHVCAGGDIRLGKQAQIHEDVYVTGDNLNITLGEQAEIHGDVYVTGDNVNITLGKQAQIHGDVYVTGDNVNIALGTQAQIQGGVYVTGDNVNITLGTQAQIKDGCHPGYSGGYPDPPECPELPGLKILVY